MSKAQLKRHLTKLTKEQVIDVILELYDARKEAKEYLEFYINPNDDAKLEELRPRIEKMLKTSEECGWGFPDTLYDFYYRYQ